MTALPLNASLPAGPVRSNSRPGPAARGVSQSSPFPALFGGMVVADGQPDAAPLKKGAAIELVQIETTPSATGELPATASAVATPVPDSLPEGPSTITAEQIGRPAGYQVPAGNPFTNVIPAPGEFAAEQPGLGKRPTMVSRTRGKAEAPQLTDAELQAKMNLPGLPIDLPGVPGLPVAQPPALLQIESGAIKSHALEFHTGEPRQPAFSLRAGTPIDASVRVSTVSALESSPGETAGLAFAARLVPQAATGTATAQQTAPEATPLPRAVPDAPMRPTAAGNPALAAPESNDKGVSAPITPYGGDNAPTGGQESKGGLPDSPKKQEPQTIADALPQTAMGRGIPHTEYTPEPRVSTPGQTAASSTAESANPKEGPGLPSGTETAKAAGAARDIRLEIGGGDHRVEVRLMERGGEVHVAVRTPDTHLASALREDLPALSSRLTESGFRIETWHPGASGAGDWHRQAEGSAGGTPQDPDNQQGQHGRDQQPGDRQPQRQDAVEEQLNQKQKGKDFKWFMSTLR